MIKFLSSKKNTQILIFGIFLSAMMANLGIADHRLEERLKPDEFTSILTKIIGIYSVHIAIMLGGFFNTDKSPAPDEIDQKSQVSSSIIFLILSLCWNFMIWITIANFSSHPNTSYSDFMHRMETISGAIYFLVAGGLSYFFGKRS